MKLGGYLGALLLISHIQGCIGQVSPHIIALFIRPLPLSLTPSLTRAVEEQKRIIGSEVILQPILTKAFNLPFFQAGMYASYAGTITHSSPEGKILFERKSPDPKLMVLITDSIKPVPINPFSEKTLSGFVPGAKARAQQYLFERLQDPETETYAWHVSSVPTDKEKRIPYDTLILYADPAHVIVPIGPTATRKSENLILPDFHVTEGYNSSLHALSFLKIRQYFAPVAFEYTFLPSGYQKKIKE